MKKIIWLVVFTVLLLIHSTGFAQDFGDYKWGQSGKEIMAILKNKKIAFTEEGDPDKNIKYRDIVFGKKCLVELYFLSEKGLITIGYKWEWDGSDAFKDKLTKILIARHGRPDQIDRDSLLWTVPCQLWDSYNKRYLQMTGNAIVFLFSRKNSYIQLFYSDACKCIEIVRSKGY